MDALVSTLVLSVGILGLAQLQAHLWVNAGQLYSDDRALHTAADRIECLEFQALTEMTVIDTPETFVTESSENFRVDARTDRMNSEIHNHVDVHWMSRTGDHELSLHTTLSELTRAAHSRWLLASP